MVSSGIMIYLGVQGISDYTCSLFLLKTMNLNYISYYPMIYLASGIAQLFIGLLMILFSCYMFTKGDEMGAKNDDLAKLVDNDDLEHEAKRQPSTLAKVVILDEKA